MQLEENENYSIYDLYFQQRERQAESYDMASLNNYGNYSEGQDNNQTYNQHGDYENKDDLDANDQEEEDSDDEDKLKAIDDDDEDSELDSDND